jgi:hypothetical protein
MILVYILVGLIGLIFFGLAGSGTFVTALYGYRLNRYRYRFMGLPDRRFFVARFWRRWKFSLYQPVLCMALAFLSVMVLSLILKPLAVAKVIGGGDISKAALQVGSWENKIYAMTGWLKSGQLLDAFLAITLTFLFINLIWPNLKIFNEVPKLRVMMRNVMIFLTTLSAFTFVSGKSINLNRAIITASLRKDIKKNDDDTNQFNSETASYKIVKDSIEKLTPEQIRQLAAVVRTVAAVESAAQISQGMGKQAGNKLKQQYKNKSSGKTTDLKKVSPLAELEDWPSLAERRAESTKQAKRAALLRKATHESMLASLDKLSIDVVDQLGGSMNRLAKGVLGAFFSGMTESVTELCASIRPGNKKTPTDADILKHLEYESPKMTTDQFFASWLDDIPDANDSQKFASTFTKRINAIDADIKVKSAAKAAKAAADAADAAKAAKAAKTILKVIF